MLTGRQIAYQIDAFFKLNDVPGRVSGSNDMLNIELRDDNLKMFDQTWEETLMAMEKERGRDFLQSLHQRPSEKSRLMKYDLALYHSDQVHRKEPTF